MTSTLAQTPLHAWHAAHGGRMVDFAGWSMPVQYGSIVEEHLATRDSVSVFDVSHMGRFRFDGPGAEAFLDALLTRRVTDMAPGRIRYSLVTNDEGRILDDVLVYRLQGAAAGEYWLLVVNAGNREKIVGWVEQHLAATHLANTDQVEFSDLTTHTAMIAVQGPRAIELASKLLPLDPGEMKYYTGRETTVGVHDGLVSRTGYTGEDGVELIVPAAAGEHVWTQLIELGATPAGLGARDTLRLEAAMPLFGHELSEQINPIQAGLQFALNLEGRSFPGRDAIAELARDSSQPRRVGLELSGKRAPREHYPILSGEKTVGEVTSGTHSPTLGKPIAMGYVSPECAAIGTELAVDIRGRSEPARVVELPFYRRKE